MERVEIGNAVLYRGDCLEILPTMTGVDAMIASPPYNIGKEYERCRPLAEYLDEQAAVIAECSRIIRPGGSLCWQVGNYVDDGEVVPLDAVLYPAIKAAGLALRNRIVWTVGHGLHAKRRFSGRHEVVLWATKGEPYHFDVDAVRVPQKYPGKKHFKGPKAGQLSCNPLGANPGDVWDIPNVKNNHPEKTDHPCQFPEELVRRLVLAITQASNLVADPFMGSGTTGAVCAKLGRRFIGIEIEPRYFDIACRRIEEAQRQADLFIAPAAAAKPVQASLLDVP